MCTRINRWQGAEWDQNVALYVDASHAHLRPGSIMGMPETEALLKDPGLPFSDGASRTSSRGRKRPSPFPTRAIRAFTTVDEDPDRA